MVLADLLGIWLENEEGFGASVDSMKTAIASGLHPQHFCWLIMNEMWSHFKDVCHFSVFFSFFPPEALNDFSPCQCNYVLWQEPLAQLEGAHCFDHEVWCLTFESCHQ